MLNKSNTKKIEPDAFRAGTQGVPLDATLNEVEAAFEARREDVNRKATDTMGEQI